MQPDTGETHSQSPDIAVHSQLPGRGRIRELEPNHNLPVPKKTPAPLLNGFPAPETRRLDFLLSIH